MWHSPGEMSKIVRRFLLQKTFPGDPSPTLLCCISPISPNGREWHIAVLPTLIVWMLLWAALRISGAYESITYSSCLLPSHPSHSSLFTHASTPKITKSGARCSQRRTKICTVTKSMTEQVQTYKSPLHMLMSLNRQYQPSGTS